MAFKLEWSEEALEDIESIATYIEKDSPFYAKSVISKFFEKAEILKDFTELGRVVPEINDSNIREIFIYSYRLIYQTNEDTVLFVAIVHGKILLENHQ
ncbi:type II toxin-antitoxin system RelE/ParE family toxin [Sulfurimonas sp.]|jgi:addiction module RelE/StbE family toxin|uniref:type II toxin-antitoxin system RelE/ParE family toxin n=1 Tax=Sulfurimonas sp. TaxID=2022749 RepID=UPI0025DEC0E0|nr:type II toxin-antitoxin system RelE/ParE family toxin [Sulfurimonas sp.]MBT5935537.1 type II toxin-antitoxin system RelE/ParE family toxin [Sulfurimonas sp.]